MHPKLPGVATPAEILEACGLDVGEFYSLLDVLKNAGLIEISGDYPMEEIRLTQEANGAQRIAEDCTGRGVPLEEVLVRLRIGEI